MCGTIAATSKDAKVHVTGCIFNLGLIYNEVRRESYISNLACDFVKKALRVAKEKYGRSVKLVIDNEPCHSKVESVHDEEEFSDGPILRLGPYSPMLIPIENVWSIFKNEVKRKLTEKIRRKSNESRFNLEHRRA